MSSTSATQDRVIRVFVSSTFRDMQAERDELVLKIFPQLRWLCEERGVTWGEIDLRWGITEEQSQRGEVLPICLEEIRLCRPYFIGLLGERYGWIPAAIPDKVLEDEPWIREHADGADKKSVTELEILHGVLRNPKMADHAFFYFRDPTFIERLSADQNQEDFITEDDQSLQKLNRLKDDIRQQHREGKLKYEPRENYPDAKSLGERVLADFTTLIDTLYPQGQEPSPLQRERLDHDAFARSRAGVYIGRQEYFDRLDAHIASDAAPLVVLGESGSGKSALLANWFLSCFPPSTSDSQPSTPFALLHFIGASPDSANSIGLLRNIMLELKERFELPDNVPAQADKIREEFPNWLTSVASRGPIVLVLDALNQLEDVDHAPNLGWLPRVFPKNCRVIVSTLPGRSLNAIEQRGWLQSTPPLLVHPLDVPERVRLTWQFLHQYRKRLSKPDRRKVAFSKQAKNPLYLRVLLNELRVFGRHEQLGERINWYLEAHDQYMLYRKVISRWQEAYSDGTNLVRDALSLICAARRGLSEAELTEALGNHDGPLPSAVWSPLHLAMSDALVSRSGLLTFAHDFLRTAVRDAYLPVYLQQQTAHRQLAKYFQNRQIVRQKSVTDGQEPQPKWTNRDLEELPWQLAAARDWQSLHDALTEQECFLGLQRRDEYELLGYWLELKPQFDLANSYLLIFSRWEERHTDIAETSNVAQDLGRFLDTAACHEAAEQFYRRSLSIAEECLGSEAPEVAERNINLALVLQATNRLDEAESLLRNALSIEEQHYGPDHPAVATCLNNLSDLLRIRGRWEEAEPIIRRALSIQETTYGPENPEVARLVSNLSLVLLANNQTAEAESLTRRALAIVERHFGPEHPDVSLYLNNLANLCEQADRFTEAELLYRRSLAISERSFGLEHPNVARTLNNLAVLFSTTNRLVEAEELLRRALTLNERCFGAEHPNVALQLNNLGNVMRTLKRLAEAEPLMRRSLAISEHSYGPRHPNVATGLNNLSLLMKDMNESAEAESLQRRALAIDEELHGPVHASVSRDLGNLGTLFVDGKRFEEAEPIIRRALAIEEQTRGPEHSNVGLALNNLAMLLKATQRLAEAEPLLRRAMAISEQSLGAEHPNLAVNLNNLALLLQATNRLAEAEPLIRRALAIDELSYGAEHPTVATNLNNLAQLLQATDRLAEAELLMRRALAIDEQFYGAENPTVAICLNNLALLLKVTNRLAEAEPLMRRALAIDEQFHGGQHPNVARDLNVLAQLFEATNRLSEAEPLMRRALAIDEQFYGAEHPKVAIRLNNLALSLQAMNRLKEAEPLMRRALAIDEQSYGAERDCDAQGTSDIASDDDTVDDDNRMVSGINCIPQCGLVLLATRCVRRMPPLFECLPNIGDAIANLAAKTLAALEEIGDKPAMARRPSRSKLQKAIEACIQAKKAASRQMNLDQAMEIFRVIQFLTSLDHAVCIALAKDKRNAVRFAEQAVTIASMTQVHRHAQQIDLEILQRAAKDNGWTDDTPIPVNFLGPLWPDNESER